ncbi:MAG: nucleoside-diphosphate-sugar epimerase [bacterium]|jgi:nucleoside-diphosphate-sugar epimerase
MKILIIGAGGMIGSKLAKHIAHAAQVANQTITTLSLVDIVPPALPVAVGNIIVNTRVADLTKPGIADSLIDEEPDLIYQLAAVVSGEAEENFDKGYMINLDGTRALLEAIRVRHTTTGYTPKLIFASSIAVYGAPFPNVIDDEFHLTPQTSYGTQKAICELLLADYNRRGFLQGIGLRLPTICIRPGLPNKAASGFFSNILREPLNGVSAVLPVSDQVKHWFASPRAAINFLLHAAGLSRDVIGLRCNMNLPGLCTTVAEELEALQRVAGSDILKLVRHEPDAIIQGIVAGWPESFTAKRAIGLGFKSESSFDDIIKIYLEDDLPSK